MTNENEFSVEHLKLLQRWFVSRMSHLSRLGLPPSRLRPAPVLSKPKENKKLAAYNDFLYMELQFVGTTLTSKREKFNGLEEPAQLNLPGL